MKRFGFLVLLSAACSSEPTTSERMLQDIERERRADEAQRVEKERAKLAADRAKAELDRKAKEAAAKRAALVAKLSKMTPVERRKTLASACPPSGPCNEETLGALPDAAGSDGERAQLTAAVGRALDAHEEHRQTIARGDFARRYELMLLGKRMNPGGVSVAGSALVVRGWFCSRQYLHDFATGPIAKEARAAGFTRVECSGAGEAGRIDL